MEPIASRTAITCAATAGRWRSEQTLGAGTEKRLALGVGQAKRQICRDRNCKSGKTLARSAHLPQKLANQAQYRHVTGESGSSERLDPDSPIFLDCCKIIHVYFSNTPFRDSRRPQRSRAGHVETIFRNFFPRSWVALFRFCPRTFVGGCRERFPRHFAISGDVQ